MSTAPALMDQRSRAFSERGRLGTAPWRRASRAPRDRCRHVAEPPFVTRQRRREKRPGADRPSAVRVTPRGADSRGSPGGCGNFELAQLRAIQAAYSSIAIMQAPSPPSGRFTARHLRRASLLGSAQRQPAPSATFRSRLTSSTSTPSSPTRKEDFVSDPMKDDFELLDDGSRRISARSRSSIFRCRRRARGRPATTARSVMSGPTHNPSADVLHDSPRRSQRRPSGTKVVIDAARELIEKHFADDMAAITYTSGRTDGAQEFTSDRGRCSPHRKVSRTEAAVDRHREADIVFETPKEIEVNQPTIPTRRPPAVGTFAGRRRSRTSR